MTDLASTLRNKLKKEGSPLAAYVPSLIRAGRQYRVDPRLIVAISAAETSYGKAGGGPAVHNAWGIGPGRPFKDWQTGITEMAKLLRTGYLNDGRKSFTALYPKYVWGKTTRQGDPEADWVKNASSVYSELGGNPNDVTRGWQAGSAPGTTGVPRSSSSDVGPVMPDFTMQAIERVAKGGSPMGAFKSMLAAPAHWKATHPLPKTPKQPGQSVDNVSQVSPNYSSLSLGKIIGNPHQGTHTLGNWQSDNAYDVAMPVGTPIRADFDGTIASNIGPLGAYTSGSRFAGDRVQVDGKGNSAWYGHLSRYVVKPGQKVKKGQVIGFSGSANGVAHLHVGFMHLP